MGKHGAPHLFNTILRNAEMTHHRLVVKTAMLFVGGCDTVADGGVYGIATSEFSFNEFRVFNIEAEVGKQHLYAGKVNPYKNVPSIEADGSKAGEIHTVMACGAVGSISYGYRRRLRFGFACGKCRLR